MKKTVFRLKGGLGNQLFIYAFAVALREKLNCEIYFDQISGFLKDNYKRSVKLHLFAKSPRSISYIYLVIFFLTKMFPRLSEYIFKSKILTETSPRELYIFSSDIINKYHVVFFDGYFQSPVYFQFYKHQILSSFQKNFISNSEITINKYLSDANSNTVSIHVRRIQYDTKLSLTYYYDAMNFISSRVNNVYFFVFSDDIQWCKYNFSKKENMIYLENSKSELEDFILMKSCRHHIIANSSFSWWSAWISNHPSKIVIAPLNTQIGVYDKFYPSEWIKI
jgi:hypothetical protein